MGAGPLVGLADLACQFECGAVLDAGIGGSSGRQEHGAEAVEGLRFACLVARLTEQGQRLPEVPCGLLVTALPQVEVAEQGESLRFACLVARLTEQGQRLPEVACGLLVTALPQVEVAEKGESLRFAGLVARLAK